MGSRLLNPLPSQTYFGVKHMQYRKNLGERPNCPRCGSPDPFSTSRYWCCSVCHRKYSKSPRKEISPEELERQRREAEKVKAFYLKQKEEERQERERQAKIQSLEVEYRKKRAELEHYYFTGEVFEVDLETGEERLLDYEEKIQRMAEKLPPLPKELDEKIHEYALHGEPKNMRIQVTLKPVPRKKREIEGWEQKLIDKRPVQP